MTRVLKKTFFTKVWIQLKKALLRLLMPFKQFFQALNKNPSPTSLPKPLVQEKKKLFLLKPDPAPLQKVVFENRSILPIQKPMLLTPLPNVPSNPVVKALEGIENLFKKIVATESLIQGLEESSGQAQMVKNLADIQKKLNDLKTDCLNASSLEKKEEFNLKAQAFICKTLSYLDSLPELIDILKKNQEEIKKAREAQLPAFIAYKNQVLKAALAKQVNIKPPVYPFPCYKIEEAIEERKRKSSEAIERYQGLMKEYKILNEHYQTSHAMALKQFELAKTKIEVDLAVGNLLALYKTYARPISRTLLV